MRKAELTAAEVNQVLGSGLEESVSNLIKIAAIFYLSGNDSLDKRSEVHKLMNENLAFRAACAWLHIFSVHREIVRGVEAHQGENYRFANEFEASAIISAELLKLEGKAGNYPENVFYDKHMGLNMFVNRSAMPVYSENPESDECFSDEMEALSRSIGQL